MHRALSAAAQLHSRVRAPAVRVCLALPLACDSCSSSHLRARRKSNRATDESRRVSVVVPRPLLTMQPLQSSNSWLIAVAMVVVCRLSNYPPNVRKDMPNNTPPLFSSFFPPLPVMCVSGGPTAQSVQVRSSGCSQPRSAARIASASQCNGSYHSR